MRLWVAQADDVTANYSLKRWRLAGGVAIAWTIVIRYWSALHTTAADDCRFGGSSIGATTTIDVASQQQPYCCRPGYRRASRLPAAYHRSETENQWSVECKQPRRRRIR